MNLLDQIDRAIDGLCPCGADPRPGSAYCGPDCEPTHISDDTDPRMAGTLATPMRWRPELVSAADDTDLIPLGSTTYYRGPYNAQLFDRRHRPEVWHLRLDDGHRFVGCDLDGVTEINDDLLRRVEEKWKALERELGNGRHLVDDDDPWADVLAPHRRDPVRALLELSRARRAHGRVIGGPIHAPASDDDTIPARLSEGCVWLFPDELAAVSAPLPSRHRHLSHPRASYHNPPVQVAALAASGVEDAMRQVGQRIQAMAPAMEAFLRDAGIQLTEWQRNMAAAAAATARTPRRHARWFAGFRPLVNRRDAAILREHGYREGEDFLLYADPPAEPAHNPDEEPADPMARALWLRRRRNTGPGPDRLDGRRRRRH